MQAGKLKNRKRGTEHFIEFCTFFFGMRRNTSTKGEFR